MNCTKIQLLLHIYKRTRSCRSAKSTRAPLLSYLFCFVFSCFPFFVFLSTCAVMTTSRVAAPQNFITRLQTNCGKNAKQEAASSNGEWGGVRGVRGGGVLVKIKKGIKLECRLRRELIHADVDSRYLTSLPAAHQSLSARQNWMSYRFSCCFSSRAEARVGGMQTRSPLPCLWFMSQSLDPSSERRTTPHLRLRLSCFRF